MYLGNIIERASTQNKFQETSYSPVPNCKGGYNSKNRAADIPLKCN